MKTLEQIQDEGFEVLMKALGPIDAIRFIRQFSKGYGNYTEERHQWLDNKSIEDILGIQKKAEMEDMMESGTYREIFEKGKEKGEKEAEKRIILKLLKTKFKKEFPQIEEKLKKVVELEELDLLVEKVALANSIEEFENVLSELTRKRSEREDEN